MQKSRHPRIRVSLVVAGLLVATLGAVSTAGAAHCGAGEFSVSGSVTDEFTSMPLDRITSVGISQTDGPLSKGENTMLPGSTYDVCLPAGSYLFSFFADDYYFEWYDDSETEAGAAVVTGSAGDDITGIDAALTPWPVITGRVTDSRTGAPLFTSVGLTDAVTGLGLDGEGTDTNGVYEFILNPAFFPVPGTYLLHFSADFHWSEWYDNSKKKSKATVISVTPGSGVISGVDAGLKPCGRPVPDFCIPRNFSR